MKDGCKVKALVRDKQDAIEKIPGAELVIDDVKIEDVKENGRRL
ncbi:hypothetical protein [Halobacillus karajensis]|nr:hypothetical protein [Halobacillus karajensis]